MKKMLIIALSALALRAQDVPQSVKPLILSGASLEASAVADALSSYGRYELNPALGLGQFGVRQSVELIGITAAIVLLEVPLARRWPVLRKAFVIGNYVGVGVHGFEAANNWRHR